LGESIVGGTVIPDTYTVRKEGPDGPQIVDCQLGDKAVMTVPVDGGTTEAPVPACLRSLPAVQDAHILEAARLAIAVEREMGWPGRRGMRLAGRKTLPSPVPSHHHAAMMCPAGARPA
jgi:phosphoenolpyruvate synthase/pyruvate phosphate dikinase